MPPEKSCAELPFPDRMLAVVRKFAPDVERLDKVVRLSGGASQETWSLIAVRARGPERMILRRMPAGVPIVEKINLETEAALMQAAEKAGVPSPHVHYVIGPEDDFGRGFFMSHVDGEALGRRIVRDEQFAAIRPQLARRAGEILARIHAIDPKTLPDLPRVTPAEEIATMFENYRRWSEPRPVFELAFRWAKERMPPEGATPRLVHGDFRNGNMMVEPDGVSAVLDWELCTIGDPVADFFWSLMYWAEPEDEISFLPDPPTRLPQFPRRAEVVACYEEITGQALPHAAFYTAFGWWKQACIVEGVYARLVKGASGGMKTAPPEQVARIVERYLERAASALA